MKKRPGTMKNHENRPRTMKNRPGTMKNRSGIMKNRPGTMKNPENWPGTMKYRPGTMNKQKRTLLTRGQKWPGRGAGQNSTLHQIRLKGKDELDLLFINFHFLFSDFRAQHKQSHRERQSRWPRGRAFLSLSYSEKWQVKRGSSRMMVGRRQLIITIISALLLFSLFNKLFSLQQCNLFDLDGFRNDPKKVKNNDNVTDKQRSQPSVEVKAQ